MSIKLLRSLGVMAALAVTTGGCAYGGVAVAGDKVVVLRNDQLVGGMLRAAFVCKYTEAGLSDCKQQDNP